MAVTATVAARRGTPLWRQSIVIDGGARLAMLLSMSRYSLARRGVPPAASAVERRRHRTTT